jgi:hypothetical protein
MVKLVELLNELHEKNEKLIEYNNKLMKQPLLFDVKTIPNTMEIIEANSKLEKENEQLKTTMKEVAELLEEEVDLFSDKATEHDINAYVELKKLDNKDAYYMATSTKKAIKMLKELEE